MASRYENGGADTIVIDAGRAGEFLAAARIEMNGWRAVLATADAVDLIAMRGGRIVRVQVKSTRQPARPGIYRFSTHRGGDRRALQKTDCDVVALVALDAGRVIFRPVADVQATTTSVAQDDVTAEAEAASFEKTFQNQPNSQGAADADLQAEGQEVR